METMKRYLNSQRSLRARIKALEAEVQESRQLHLRLAELMDVVTELLVPLAEQDTEGARQLLANYRNEVDSTPSESRVNPTA